MDDNDLIWMPGTPMESADGQFVDLPGLKAGVTLRYFVGGEIADRERRVEQATANDRIFIVSDGGGGWGGERQRARTGPGGKTFRRHTSREAEFELGPAS